ncbi:MAG TPA: M56 family metallopeptidase [Acidobacteriaceae bacterium]|jgi:beta-lactamase regulating signal transducer with metallopeptidase domain|nr:M56 family metallopeptidase [Acidobacteriaceae bacterium]
MTELERLCALPAVHALGWTLLHFCWEGTVVALLLAVVPRRAPEQRYAAAVLAMAAMVLLPLVTFVWLTEKSPAAGDRFAAVAGDPGPSSNTGESISGAKTWVTRCERGLDASLPALVGFWVVGVVVLSGRLNLALAATRRMRKRAAHPAPAELQSVLQRLAERMGVKRVVELMHSAQVQAPTVIGWLRPAILMPVGCLTGLSTAQLEAVLAHELAHIRRHDYLAAILQAMAETVLFYHPAVWWISAQMRREREHCCDDAAAQVSGDRVMYARALVVLEEKRGAVPAGAVGANGGSLKMRIERLLGRKESPAISWAAAMVLLVMAGMGAGVLAVTVHAQTAANNQVEAALPQNQAPPPQIIVDKSCLIQPESDPFVLGDHYNGFHDDAICHLESVLSSHHTEEKITDGETSHFFVQVNEQEYVLQNPTDKPAVFIIRHDVPENWTVDSDPQPSSMDGSTAVFQVNAEPGQRIRLHVGMHQSQPVNPN